VGDSTEVVLRGKGAGINRVTAEWVVMEADDLIASHDPMSFAKREDYPEGVQERRYHEDPGEQSGIENIARGLIPAMVINTNPSPIDGAPMVTEKGIVLGGNKRTMGMQRAYRRYPENGQQLKEHIAGHARAFGLSPQQVMGMDKPVLVRRMSVGDDKAKLTRMGRRMNEALTQGLDPSAEQVAISHFVTQDVVDDLAHRMSPDEPMSKFLFRSTSIPFVETLERAGIIDERNKSEFVERATGLLNEAGRDRVSRAFAARMIPDADLLDAMVPTWRASIAQAVPYLLQAESAGWDMRPGLRAAVEADLDMKKKGFPRTPTGRKDYLKQLDLDKPELRKPETQALLQILHEKGKKKNDIAQGMKQVALHADRQKHDHGEQPSFGLIADPKMSLADALYSSFGLKPEVEEKLAASLSVRAALAGFLGTELRKAEVAPEKLSRYLMHAVLWELDNLMRGATKAAKPGEGVDGKALLAKLKRFIADQAKADSNFARALGAHPLDDETLRGLLQASAKARVSEIAKSLARAYLWTDLRKARGECQPTW
jgi:hypothetical protein